MFLEPLYSIAFLAEATCNQSLFVESDFLGFLVDEVQGRVRAIVGIH